MNTREMQLDFKRKFNKSDSQKNRNFLVPEIDLYLNEGAELIIKRIAEPKAFNGLGFETSQRTIEDIKSIVEPGDWTPVTNGVISLPEKYLYYVRGRVKISKGKCIKEEAVLYIREHRDLFEESSFYNGSFEWREVNGLFNTLGIQTFNDGTFTVDEAKISFIRKMRYFHNAQDFGNAGYEHPSEGVLTGTVACELPAHMHREVVDVAVMLAASEIQTSDLQAKLAKLGYNQLF